MSFTTFTTCPVCGCHTPLLKREQKGKIVQETCSCPVHGFIFWDTSNGCRKLITFGQKVPREELQKATTFMDRCHQWSDLRFTDYKGIRRIPQKRRFEKKSIED